MFNILTGKYLSMYMSVASSPFFTKIALFPIAWSVLQAFYNGQVTNQWEPLTLKGAGLFHMAMGAILGIAAWSRGQEKLAGITGTLSPINTRPTLRDPEFRNTRNDY